jgi:hypothetical protein
MPLELVTWPSTGAQPVAATVLQHLVLGRAAAMLPKRLVGPVSTRSRHPSVRMATARWATPNLGLRKRDCAGHARKLLGQSPLPGGEFPTAGTGLKSRRCVARLASPLLRRSAEWCHCGTRGLRRRKCRRYRSRDWLSAPPHMLAIHR